LIQVLALYFPVIYDMKYLMKFTSDALHGGLQKLAEVLVVERIGPQHQAGSDALLTSRTFFKLRDTYFPPPKDNGGKEGGAKGGINAGLEKYVNVLYGLGVDGQAAGEETAAGGAADA
jgi:CCR4-NOT transcription complex subunit 7/8